MAAELPRDDAASHWKIVALSSAVRGEPKAVRCDQADHVLFRDEAGRLHALADRCAHRRAPLSLGKIIPGGIIECPYHGWRYDGTGACVAIPNLVEGDRIPRTYRVAAAQVIERDGFVHLNAVPDAGALPARPDDWTDIEAVEEVEQLVAYPADQLLDVILEAPGAFLAPRGARILDDMPFGDPDLSTDAIRVEYAVEGLRRRPTAKVVGDFPLRISISAALHANMIDIAIGGHDDVPVACARLAITAVTPGLSVVHLRSAPGVWEGRPLGIGLLAHPDAAGVARIKPYASILRRSHAAREEGAAA
ncbi:MAG: hypothetical protein JWR77_1120 [Rhizorhabdus sp.]|nr:hypothetical protein [Rhizorhabdus sp.]